MLKLTDITKSFGGVKALRGVSLAVQAGEIHALLGENGAGKSTLMKVISGAHKADSGTIIFNEKPIVHNNPHLAKENGIRIIYQEFSLVPELSVAENIYLGRKRGSPWIDYKQMHAESSRLIDSLGFDIDVRKKVGELTIAQQQVVEIVKALSEDVKLLILDEPSAVLGVQEVKKLFTVLRQLKDQGVAIIYISHHLEELLEITDQVTVLKDGKSILTVQTKDMDKDKLVQHMVGRALQEIYPVKQDTISYGNNIHVHDLITKLDAPPISFDIRQGEILGIGGLVGSGRTEVLESLFCLFSSKGSSIKQEERIVKFNTPREAVQQGWGMVPEDRKRFGGILDLSIRENISLANLSKICNRWGWINSKKEKAVVQDLIAKLQIKLDHINSPLSSLSGGNQQKVILAKWLNLDLKLLLIDEPTRGVDVGARAEIYSIIQELADEGMYIVMVSSDMEELMGMSDRILILKNGRLMGTLDRAEFSEEKILRMAIGAN